MLSVADHIAHFPYRTGNELDDKNNIDVLTQLTREQAINGLIIERHAYEGDKNCKIEALGISVFIDISTANKLLDIQIPTTAEEYLYKLERRKKGTILRKNEVAKLNRNEGVALVILHISLPHGDPDDPCVTNAVDLMQANFRLLHAGNRCKLFLHPMLKGDPRALKSLTSIGFLPAKNGSSMLYFDFNLLSLSPAHPFAFLLNYQLPIFGFSNGEKNLLLLSLLNRSDEEIGDDLHISFETVRKRWSNIFNKIEGNNNVNLFPRKPQSDFINGKRGPEKRRHVLSYLHSHLEELRPY